MNWQYAPYVLPLIIAAIILAAVVLLAWRRRPAPGAATLGWVMGAVLTFTGYVAGVAQNPAAIAGLRLLMSFVPIAGLIGAFICLIFYPLHGARLAQVKEQVVKLHEEKAKKAEQPSQ
ncbi:MAG: hypothetical protein KJ606_08015 [Chloroflexi bacterium]|nr:hypothetical protein [Chloroflexota bacterium]